MKQPLILTAEERQACADALLAREVQDFLRTLGRSADWALGVVRRAETYLAMVHAHENALRRYRREGRPLGPFKSIKLKRPDLAGDVLVLAVAGHGLLVDLVTACGSSRIAAAVLADVAFGVTPDDPQLGLNLAPAPASE